MSSNLNNDSLPTQLTKSEKEYLYSVIVSVIGEDTEIMLAKNRFNVETVRVVETILMTNKRCNSNIQELVVGLLGGMGHLAKGWLRKAIFQARKGTKKVTFKGQGCAVVTKSRWKTPILNSTI